MIIECPYCKQRYNVMNSSKDEIVKCQSCGSSIRLPEIRSGYQIISKQKKNITTKFRHEAICVNNEEKPSHNFKVVKFIATTMISLYGIILFQYQIRRPSAEFFPSFEQLIFEFRHREAINKVDFYVNRLYDTYESYGIFESPSIVYVAGRKFWIKPLGRLVVIDTDNFNTELMERMSKIYKRSHKVHNVFINGHGNVAIDCRK